MSELWKQREARGSLQPRPMHTAPALRSSLTSQVSGHFCACSITAAFACWLRSLKLACNRDLRSLYVWRDPLACRISSQGKHAGPALSTPTLQGWLERTCATSHGNKTCKPNQGIHNHFPHGRHRSCGIGLAFSSHKQRCDPHSCRQQCIGYASSRVDLSKSYLGALSNFPPQ